MEDALWADKRFMRFCIRMGDEVRAVGSLVLAWKLAQKHWCPERGPIPDAEWLASELPEALIECGLAERKDDGVYLKGAEEQFAWWFDGIDQRRKAGRTGGRISAQRPRDEKGRLLPKQTQASPNGRLDETQANPSEPKPSTSSSSSSSSSEDKNINKKPAQAGNPLTAEDVAEGVSTWLETLRHFKSQRETVLPEERELIARSIQRWGKPPVIFALTGKRFEPKSEKYDPGKNLSLRGILNHQEPAKFERLMNLGVQGYHREGRP